MAKSSQLYKNISKHSSKKKTSLIKLGLAQIDPTVGDFEKNIEKILSYVKEGEKRGLDLIIFPELSVTGYPVWDLANKVSFVEKSILSVNRIASETKNYNIAIILGHVDNGVKGSRRGRSHNAVSLIHGGRIVAKQFKSLLPTYDVFLEEIFFEPAKDQKVFQLFGTKIGLSVCEDLWEDDYDQKPFANLKRKGAKIIINIAASPFHHNKGEFRAKLVSRKARQYGVYLIYCNQVGAQDELIFDGRSLIADPKGRILFESKAFREDLFEYSLDLERTMPEVKVDYSKSNTADIYEALVLGIRDYVIKNKFGKVLIGLSGGIDSALTAVLAVDALGASNVLGVTMPGPYSSKGSIEDSRKLASKLGIEFREHSIKELYELKIQKLVENKKKENKTIREINEITLAMENLQARLRGLELMYISNDEGRLVLATGNKSELAMGYCTLYGDMSGGLCVLGDVYKTDVYRLAEFRNKLSLAIPLQIIEKKPSAELRPNQTDQDSLPPYEILDEILKNYIEKNISLAQIIKLLKGRLNPEIIRKTIRIVDHNEYKRRQAAPVLRVSEKAWFGRRMPITNRFDVEEL